MGNHDFSFVGGNILSKIGATFFVSYLFYNIIDDSHDDWKNIKTASSRISKINSSKMYHKIWLEQVLLMNDRLLERNTIGLMGFRTKEMANIILNRMKVE